MNNLNNKTQEPKEEIFIGQGVTKSIGSDSYACLFIAIEQDMFIQFKEIKMFQLELGYSFIMTKNDNGFMLQLSNR